MKLNRQIKTIVTSIAAGGLLTALAMAQPTSYGVTDLGTVGPAGRTVSESPSAASAK
jgi:hypothetical protein